MNLPVADQPRPPEKPATAGRFQFATGDRPLSGYTIKRGVGRGGFGEVYFAISDGGKEVALKLIRRNLDIELRGVQHCLNLKHPNLIALYDVRQDGEGEDCWIVMEYVAGESLEGAIRRHPQGMPAEEAIAWLRGIAAGASYLHSHGIVHRDLKPGNVFREESQVKLGDYGLSKFISCSRRSGQTESVGTVHYMAPEIAHGRYGREIDIYALGVILYEMLTGRVPFDGESVGEVLMKHLTAQPDVNLVPAAYRSVVARALAKDPAVRFGTIEAFLAALPGAEQGPAAAAPFADTAKRPEFYHDQVSGQRRAVHSDAANRARRLLHHDEDSTARHPGSRARPAAFDSVPPARTLWLLGTILVLLALSPSLATLSFIPSPLHVGGRLAGVSLFAGVVLLALSVRAKALWKAGQQSADPDWSTSDVPPPLPPTPARGPQTNPAAAPQRSVAQSIAFELGRTAPMASERAVPALVVKGPRERLIDLLASWLWSSAIAIVLSVIAAACQRGDSGVEEVAWFALTSTLGTWGILVLSKLWEGSQGEPILRRFAMLVVGLGLGAGSFGLDRLLMVRLPFHDSIRPAPWHIDWSFYNRLDGAPHLEAYLAYFGMMFFLVPWWRQADPLRPLRVRPGSIAWTLLVAVALNLICPFPQPWGVIVAMIISLTVQLATAPAQKANRAAR